MKFLLSLFSVGVFSASVFSQTLSFSRVLTVDANVQTVPAGKVWKVENMAVTSGVPSSSATNTSTPTPTNFFTYFLDGNEYSATTFGGSTQAGYSSSTSSSNRIVMVPDREIFPFWLPSGSTLATGSGIGLFSVIEFTVNP